MFLLRKNGVKADFGIHEYPKITHTEGVELLDDYKIEVDKWRADVAQIIGQEVFLPTLLVSKCKLCSYFNFCWVGED